MHRTVASGSVSRNYSSELELLHIDTPLHLRWVVGLRILRALIGKEETKTIAMHQVAGHAQDCFSPRKGLNCVELHTKGFVAR